MTADPVPTDSVPTDSVTATTVPAATVAAPLDGDVVALGDVPDPVFASLVLGAGAAIEPAAGATEVRVLAPVGGRLAKLHPHAFIVIDDAGNGVLVHLGIDTVKLHGEGFTVSAAEGDRVAAGDPVVTFDPSVARAAGMSAVCPVVVMQTPVVTTTAVALPGSTVRQGEPLFTWTPAATA